MKITHFNGFDEDSSFRRQLKQKMQDFEPEVSNTLWDRIELNLASQQEKNSKKGLWILVWFLSIGFTALLTWGIYDYIINNENTGVSVQDEKPLYVNTEKTQTPLESSENINHQKTESIFLDAPENNVQSGTTNSADLKYPSENVIANNYPAKKSNRFTGNPLTGNNANTTNQSASSNSENHITGNNAKNESLKTPENTKEKDTEALPLAKVTELNSTLLINHDSNKTAKAPTSDASKNTKKAKGKKLNLERLSLAFYQVSAYNYRTVKTVEGSSPDPEMARANDKNNYEKGAFSYNNIGLNIQYKVAEHWEISAGYGSYRLENKVQFDSLRKKDKTPIGSVAWYGNEKDSVAIGNGKTYQSTWSIQQIPVEVTYKNKINGKLSYVVGTGIEYNIVKYYSYRMFDAKFRNDFIPIEKGNNYDKQFADAGFKNYFSIQLRAGAEYQIFGRWSIRVNAYGSKAVQSYSKKESGVDTQPYRLGLQTGLIFNLK